jgi:hypothetical protein
VHGRRDDITFEVEDLEYLGHHVIKASGEVEAGVEAQAFAGESSQIAADARLLLNQGDFPARFGQQESNGQPGGTGTDNKGLVGGR